jgi:hypothetical protein
MGILMSGNRWLRTAPAVASVAVFDVALFALHRLTGGHHFDGNYSEIGRRILQAVPPRKR